MWYLRSLERAGVIQKLTILERKNDVVLLNTHVPVSGTWSILFPKSMQNVGAWIPAQVEYGEEVSMQGWKKRWYCSPTYISESNLDRHHQSSLKGQWTTSVSSPNFFQISWDFYTIGSVYLCSDCMLNLTCNFNLITKICEFFLQRPFLKVYF